MSRITRALLSVSDKSNLVDLGKFLVKHNVEILSTGGTAAALRAAGVAVKDVSEHTGHPEILNGRVKTLHPRVHGGILGVRGNATHESEMKDNAITPIDLVVVNLYPFRETVAKGAAFDDCIENIDIGGPAMVRSAAKNHASVVIVTDPGQYTQLMEEMEATGAGTSPELRRKFAAAAYKHTAMYDTAISEWFEQQLAPDATIAQPVVRRYKPEFKLKYGCNPHQSTAMMASIAGEDKPLPFKVVNGTPGYINLLDALNAWQLVKELRTATGLPAAASFKHVSPAGAAIATALTSEEEFAYELKGKTLSPAALAYLRARNADPLCSFGDFAALSDVVDIDTAMVLKTEVSDGIIAPGFTPEALEVLKQKKSGNFIILEADNDFAPPELEYREVMGAVFVQSRNHAVFDAKTHLTEVASSKKELSDEAARDLVVASIALKYTQSNSVAYAKNGQLIGVGAGQQSRVDCVKLAGRKVETWWMRQHPKVLGLPFKEGSKRQDRVNARVRYIEGDFTDEERTSWGQQFDSVPEPLTSEEKAAWMKSLHGVALSSDAFFPFRDSIDHASQRGVQYVAQPGGSVADAAVVAAADEYGMTMAMTKMRLFHH